MYKSLLAGLALACFTTIAHGDTDTFFDRDKAFSQLKDAVSYFDEIGTLPRETWFTRDQASATEDMNALIDEAMETLDVPALVDMRRQYRALEAHIADERTRIAELKEKRLTAPDTEASTLTRYTPTDMLKTFTASTRGDYELLIKARQDNISAWQQDMDTLEQQMADALNRIGVTLSAAEVDTWLSSAVGDDVLSMSAVFASIKAVTGQLAQLTEESGEDLSYARRYYGMVMILHKLVVRMQQQFIDHVDQDILPVLAEFDRQAQANIAQARTLIQQGGNRSSLSGNIEANQLTRQAIALYTRLVSQQRDKVRQSLVRSQKEALVAVNTYRTVNLSSQVSGLIREGQKTFRALSNLQIPATTTFRNQQIKEEFRKLTERLRAAGP